MDKHKISNCIKNTLIDLISDLNDNVCTSMQEKFECSLAIPYFSSQPDYKVAKTILENVFPHAEEIKSRNVNYFSSKSGSIFKDLPADRVEYYSNKISHLNPDDLNIVWDYFDVLIDLARQYEKLVK